MLSHVAVLLVLVTPDAIETPLPVAAEKQLRALQGKWEVTRVEAKDGAIDFKKGEGEILQFKGRKWIFDGEVKAEITAIDPVGMELLFERFLSESRGEWPDIDLDLPSEEKREQAIQYVYKRYGELGAAMTANVTTYRQKSAAREVGKALGSMKNR